MREECIYIADDGTKFDERWRCEEYEHQLEAESYRNDLLCFAEYGGRLSLVDEENLGDNVSCVVLKSASAFEYFNNILKNLRMVELSDIKNKAKESNYHIAVYWNNDKFKWELCTDRVLELKTNVEQLENRIKEYSTYVKMAQED